MTKMTDIANKTTALDIAYVGFALTALISIIGWLLVNENRVTVLETDNKHTVQILSEIKADIKSLGKNISDTKEVK